MAIAPEYISPQPITTAEEFGRRFRETFNLPLYIPDVGHVDVELEDPMGMVALLREQLTAIGDERFQRELADALITTAVTNDFRPLIGVLAAWFRTGSFKASPRYEEAAAWARTITDEQVGAEAKDVEDVIAELGLEESA